MPRMRKKATTMTGPSPAMGALVDYLRAHPRAEYREVLKVVGRKGHQIYPVMYGRAQVLLGIVRTKKRHGTSEGPKRSAPADTRTMTPAVRRSGRNTLPTGAAAHLRQFLAEYEDLRRERDALREALRAARKAIAGVVG